MANKVISIKFSEISENIRFEPKYYLFKAKHKLAMATFSFLPLGKLGNNIARGQSPKPYTYKKRGEGDYIFIRTADLKRNILNTQTIVYLGEETFKTQKSNRIVANDLLISVVGNYLGSTVVIPQNISVGTFNDNSARVRIYSDKVTPFWVSAFLNSKFGQELIHSMATRTGQKILSAGNVKMLEIPIIPNEIFSARLEVCINKSQVAQNCIFKAFDLFASYLNSPCFKQQYIFTSTFSYISDGDLWTPRYSFPLYRQAISDIKDRFKTERLGNIANIKKGDEVGSEEYIGYVDKKESDIPFIRTTDIVNFEPDLYPDFFVSEYLYEQINQNLITSEVLFTKDGKIGITGMLNDSDKIILSSGFARISLNSKGLRIGLTPEYLFVALSNPIIGGYQARQRTVTASTIPHLREERLKEFIIPVFDEKKTLEITKLIKEANLLKSEIRIELKSIKNDIDNLFELKT